MLREAVSLLESCRAQGVMIATAESCTGGLLSAALTEVPGSSDVFDRGFVTYSYGAKTDLLGVDPTELHRHGAVSEPVAQAMAIGAIQNSNAQLSLAITGVAGPGASEAKPEGLVWFGWRFPDGELITERREFGPVGRSIVRQKSVETALSVAMLRLAQIS